MNSSEIVEFPYEIKDVDPKLNAELMKYFTGQLSSYVRVGPKGYFFPHKFKQEAHNIYNLPVRFSDIFISSFPRSGTTWTQELIWMVVNDLDYVKSNANPLSLRYAFVEASTLFDPLTVKQLIEENKESEQKAQLIKAAAQSIVDELKLAPSPRYIKSHLPLSLLPPALLDTAKLVYLARDPRDVAVSFYHLSRLSRLTGYVGDFKTYWNLFIKDLTIWAPFFEHLKEAWEKRHHPHMLFLFYEELSKDLPTTVRRVSAFFGKQYTEQQIQQLCKHLHFDNFRTNKSLSSDIMEEIGVFKSGEQSFIRKGKVGGWRDYFDDKMTEQAERWIEDNLRDTDLRFPHLHQQ